MKTLQQFRKILPAFLLTIMALGVAHISSAQTRKEKQAAQKAQVQQWVEAKRYVFVVQTVLPTNGRVRQMTPDFTFKVTPDTLFADLPYFGRAYSAPIDPSKGGIRFRSTDFDYTTDSAKGRWDIQIKPKDDRDVQSLTLNITESGFASLKVISVNRQPISYNGYIKAID